MIEDAPEELHDWLGTLREFGREELCPAERALDRIAEPEEAYTSELYRSIRARGSEVGLNRLLLPKAMGGPDLPPTAFFYALEELCAAGAPGLALISVSDPLGAVMAAGRKHPVFEDYVASFLEDATGKHSGAWAVSEPLLGADMVNDGHQFACVARPADDGGWIIDGDKSRWVGNGWLADMVILMAHVEGAPGGDGSGVFLVPMDWPGVSRGAPVRKAGLRALNQSQVSFEACHVPAEFLLYPPFPGYRKLLYKGFLAPGNLSMGFASLGIARAAYDLALDYSGSRISGGKAIAGHQLVAKRLFDAYAAIRAASGLLRAAADAWAAGRMDLPLIFAARVTACRTALQVTQDVLYLHGANGIAQDHGIEKLWRDAQPLQMADGPTEVIAVEGARLLVAEHAALRTPVPA